MFDGQSQALGQVVGDEGTVTGVGFALNAKKGDDPDIPGQGLDKLLAVKGDQIFLLVRHNKSRIEGCSLPFGDFLAFVHGVLLLADGLAGSKGWLVPVEDAQIGQFLLQADTVDEGIFAAADASSSPYIHKQPHPRLLQCPEKPGLVKAVHTNRGNFGGSELVGTHKNSGQQSSI